MPVLDLYETSDKLMSRPWVKVLALLLLVTLLSSVFYVRFSHLTNQKLSTQTSQNNLTKAELNHLKQRYDKGNFGNLTVQSLTTDYLSISTDIGKAQFLASLRLNPNVLQNLNSLSINSLANLPTGAPLPSYLTGLIGRCPGCVQLQSQSPGLLQLGHLAIAGIGTFGLGVNSNGDVFAGGTIQAARNIATGQALEAAGNLTVGGNALVAGRLGLGTASPQTQLDVEGNFSANQVASISTGVKPVAVKVVDGYAYVTDYTDNEFQIFDVSRPATPLLLSTVSTGLNPVDIIVVGNYAFITCSSSANLQVFDISNKLAPTPLSSVDTGPLPVGLSAQGHYLYAAGYGSNQLLDIDVSSPTKPFIAGRINTAATGPLSVVVHGNYAYVAAAGGNLEIYNVADPTAPVALGTVISHGSLPGGVYLNGHYVYMLNNASNTMDVVDVSDVNNPVIINSVDTGTAPVTVSGAGHYLFVASGSYLIQVFDITNPTNPVNISNITPGSSATIYGDGRYAYVTDDNNNSLDIFDGSGGFIQQLRAGLINVDNVTVNHGLSVSGPTLTAGGLAVDRGLAVYGNSSFFGNTQVKGTSNNVFAVQNASGYNLLSVNSANLNVNVDQSALLVNGFASQTAPSLSFWDNQGGSLSGASGTTYYYKITALNAQGESVPSPEASMSTSAFTPIDPPGVPNVAINNIPGNLNGTYTYKISFVNTNGETFGGTTSDSVTPTNQQVDLSNIPIGPAGTLARKIYRTPAGGADNSQQFESTINDNTTTSFTDNLADSGLGAGLPASNTATTNTNRIQISFSLVQGATSYRIYRGTSPNNETSYQTTTTSPFIDNGSNGTSAPPPTSSLVAKVGIGTTSPNANLEVEGTAIFKNQADSNSAFLVQNAAGTAALAINTTTLTVTVQNLVVNGPISLLGHIITSGSSPTIVPDAAAGTGATASLSGNDTAGTVSITTGSAPSSGDLATITFAASFGANPRTIFSPADRAASQISYYQGVTTTNSFVFDTSSTPTSSTTYVYNYWVSQ